ncbi:hypothetical protein ERJ75_001234600 [Trypanosoma vivax]|uniref:Uncharacterized protein n=1 Tax=Trypanosoma vivax (strain Y486) TaxID=1055687 RepID=G0U0S4_TRYVY|nr:hypothetical protein TRVL_00038 [Trypanosoma vivax]KAH8609020.1 hypothetical protein ERJ75_001234600 [Trypanosoma vivax]CCC49674.1 conserved hypothetical protein [Trypanosoma vivax Y486]
MSRFHGHCFTCTHFTPSCVVELVFFAAAFVAAVVLFVVLPPARMYCIVAFVVVLVYGLSLWRLLPFDSDRVMLEAYELADELMMRMREESAAEQRQQLLSQQPQLQDQGLAWGQPAPVIPPHPPPFTVSAPMFPRTPSPLPRYMSSSAGPEALHYPAFSTASAHPNTPFYRQKYLSSMRTIPQQLFSSNHHPRQYVDMPHHSGSQYRRHSLYCSTQMAQAALHKPYNRRLSFSDGDIPPPSAGPYGNSHYG